MIKNLLKNKEHLYIGGVILILTLILLVVQMIFRGLNGDFWLSIIPNLITDLIGFVIATYIFSLLLNRKQERDVKQRAYKMIGEKYKEVISSISELYIICLTREPMKSKGNLPKLDECLEQIKNINNNIEEYIDSNFFVNKIHLIYFNDKKDTNNVFERFEDHYIDRMTYTEYFKNEVNVKIDLLLTKYISVLPDDLRKLLFFLENNMRNNIFLDPNFLIPNINPSKIKFEVQEFVNGYAAIGSSLISLINYFEYEEK